MEAETTKEDQSLWMVGLNLVQRRIIHDNRCESCKTEVEMGIHALWNCGVFREIWVGCSTRLQKCVGDQADMLQIMEELVNQLCTDELEQFLVQAWFIWQQQNAMIHRKQMQALEVLIK